MEGRDEEEEGGRWAGGGTGGKMTRRSLARKALAATPYDRPRPSDGGASRFRRFGDGEGEGGWFSRARLLLSPASRVLPSIFSSVAATGHSPSSSEDTPGPGSSGAAPLDIEKDKHVDISKQVFNSEASSLNETGSSRRDDHPGDYCKNDKHGRSRLGNTSDGIGFADIEQRLKQKTFSRDESNRLIELLRSRTADLAQDDKHGMGFRTHGAGDAWDQKNVKSIKEEKPVQMNVRVDNERVFDEAGASPVEIAKAFMESRSLTLHRDSSGGFLRADKSPPSHADSAANSTTTLVSQMPQSCWPGAVVHADNSYFTPQNQGSRTGFHSIPRTPFHGESFQRSLTKCTNERRPNLSLTGWRRLPTPVFGTNKKRMSTPDNSQPAILPIVGVEQNARASASRGATLYNSTGFKLPLPASSNVFGASTSTMQMSLEPSSSGCSIVKHQTSCTENNLPKASSGSFRVHPKSSEVARKIFEHLDRTIPSLQDKSLETKFLVEKKTSLQSSVRKMLNGWDNKPSPASPSTSFLLSADVITENAEIPKNLAFVSTGDKNRPATDHPWARKEGIVGSNTSVIDSSGPEVQKSMLLRSPFVSGHVPATSSASRPEKASRFPENIFSASLPASVASNASCEHVPKPNLSLDYSTSKEGTIPSFSFGLAIGGGPIFSFGPAGDPASVKVAESSIPHYRFGSNDSSRLRFRSFGNDTVCY